MRLLSCLIIGVAACTPPPPAVLPSDVTFTQPQIAQCLASEGSGPDDGYACCQTLTLYATGDVANLSGKDGFYGSYQLDGDVATGTVSGQAFALDLLTDIATGASVLTGQWIPDADNVAAIACGL